MNTSFNLTYLEMGVDRGEAGVAPANPTPPPAEFEGGGLFAPANEAMVHCSNASAGEGMQSVCQNAGEADHIFVT